MISLGKWFARLPILVAAAAPAPQTNRDVLTLDCGVYSLFILARLEGRDVTIDRLSAVLPAPRREGYSMAELAAAGESLGAPLQGVSFTRGDPPLSRPVIAFFQDESGGHFAVLRPVGSTGSMVQIIDPPRAPRITDYNRILAAKSWTGRVLTPRDSWFGSAWAVPTAVFVGLVFAAFSFGIRARRAKPRSS